MGYGNVLGTQLLQGSFPTPGSPLKSICDVLVLAAFEVQPPASDYPDVEVLHVPLDDAPWAPTPDEIKLALQASFLMTQRILRGKRVLSTCYQGRNRSGLLSALTLENLGFSSEQAIARVRAARNNALTNKHFVQLIRLHGAYQAQRTAA